MPLECSSRIPMLRYASWRWCRLTSSTKYRQRSSLKKQGSWSLERLNRPSARRKFTVEVSLLAHAKLFQRMQGKICRWSSAWGARWFSRDKRWPLLCLNSICTASFPIFCSIFGERSGTRGQLGIKKSKATFNGWNRCRQSFTISPFPLFQQQRSS